MEYQCKTMPFDKLIYNQHGFVNPLCNDCINRDCSRDIERKKVSILGIKKEMRVMIRGGNINVVIQCEGYVKNG